MTDVQARIAVKNPVRALFSPPAECRPSLFISRRSAPPKGSGRQSDAGILTNRHRTTRRHSRRSNCPTKLETPGVRLRLHRLLPAWTWRAGLSRVPETRRRAAWTSIGRLRISGLIDRRCRVRNAPGRAATGQLVQPAGCAACTTTGGSNRSLCTRRRCADPGPPKKTPSSPPSYSESDRGTGIGCRSRSGSDAPEHRYGVAPGSSSDKTHDSYDRRPSPGVCRRLTYLPQDSMTSRRRASTSPLA